jgi:hypothetical protein
MSARKLIVSLLLPIVAQWPCLAADAPGPPPTLCKLYEAASLDMRTTTDGTFEVPVSLGSRTVYMMVDTGSEFSSITEEMASEFGVKHRLTMNGGAFLNNIVVDEFGMVGGLKIGMLSASERVPLGIIPNRGTPATEAGLLGPDFMSQADVEFDFFRGKFNMFLNGQCSMTPVYWTHDAYAVLPIKSTPGTLHIDVEAQLDGRNVRVTFDTGSSASIMSLDAARETFGWAANDPRIKSIGEANINGGEATPQYMFPFSALTFDGITVANPQITMIPRHNFMDSEHDDVSVVLGMTVLRQLHMYVDYKDSKLYLTDAEAK